MARPASTKSFPPSRCVLNQTSSEASVQGVRMPTKKFRETLPRKLPTTAMRSPTPASAPRVTSTGFPIAAESMRACMSRSRPRIADWRIPQTGRKLSKRNPRGEIAGSARRRRKTPAMRAGMRNAPQGFEE
jgi:hypothetical protein